MKLNETTEYKELPLKIQWAVNNLVSAGAEIRAEKENLNKQLESLTSFQPAQDLFPFPKYFKVWDKDGNNAFNYTGGSYYNDKTDFKPVTTIEKLQEFLELNDEIYQKNLVICKNNEKAKKLAFTFLDKLGLKQKKYDYVGRRKNKEHITCDWVKELESFFVINCEYTYKQNTVWANNEIVAINKYEKYLQKQKELLKKEEEDKIKGQEKTALIVRLITKYNLSFDEPIPPVYEVKEKLAKMNKYLYLASYMAKNRGDWNDGYSYAETGLSYFVSLPDKQTAKLDNAIYEEVFNAIHGDDCDGRVFRDLPNYNYDVLFNIAAEKTPELYADWSKLEE